MTQAIPTMRGEWEVQEFSFDIERIAERLSLGKKIRQKDFQSFTAKEVKYVFFHEGSVPMHINHLTALLLALIDKERLTVSELLKRLQELLNHKSTESIKHELFSAMEGLYWEGALHFESVH